MASTSKHAKRTPITSHHRINAAIGLQLKYRTFMDIPKEIRIEFVRWGKRRGIRSIDVINGLKRALKLLRRIEKQSIDMLLKNSIIECNKDGKLDMKCFDVVFLRSVKRLFSK